MWAEGEAEPIDSVVRRLAMTGYSIDTKDRGTEELEEWGRESSHGVGTETL